MLLLQNGRVIDPKSGLDQVMDLVTDDKKILELGNDLKEKYPDINEFNREFGLDYWSNRVNTWKISRMCVEPSTEVLALNLTSSAVDWLPSF